MTWGTTDALRTRCPLPLHDVRIKDSVAATPPVGERVKMSNYHGKTVRDVLSEALDAFQVSHERHWKEYIATADGSPFLGVAGDRFGPREEWYDEMMGLGAKALRLAEELSGEDFETTYELQEALEPGLYLDLPETAIQLELVGRLAADLPALVARTEEVLRLAADFRVAREVAAYARKLGRCYVAGLDTECVILCRSVLDAALKDVLDDEAQPRNMARRIDAAVQEEIMHPDWQEHAHCVRIRGNKAVHDEPGLTTAVYDTLRTTLFLVADLYGVSGELPPPPSLA